MTEMTMTPQISAQALPSALNPAIHLKSMMTATTYHRTISGEHSRSTSKSEHPLCHVDDFPGSMCLKRLALSHMLTQLDSTTYFPTRFCHNEYLRIHVVRDVIPYGSIASGLLAAWVWLGGDFPEHIDITRSTHYHSILFGRRVRTTSRQIHSSYLVEFPQLLVTNPQRTACDLACSEDSHHRPDYICALIRDLATQYNFTQRDCIELMRENTRKPHYTIGMNILLRTLQPVHAQEKTPLSEQLVAAT